MLRWTLGQMPMMPDGRDHLTSHTRARLPIWLTNALHLIPGMVLLSEEGWLLVCAGVDRGALRLWLHRCLTPGSRRVSVLEPEVDQVRMCVGLALMRMGRMREPCRGLLEA